MEIKYRFHYGVMLALDCPNKKQFVVDRTLFNFPPKVGSGYCTSQCEFCVEHRNKDKIVVCSFPEVQNVK